MHINNTQSFELSKMHPNEPTHLALLQVFQPTGNLEGEVLHVLHVEQTLAVDVVVSEGGHRVSTEGIISQCITEGCLW